MKYLPLILGIFVLVLFGLVATGMLLYAPLRLRYYVDLLNSDLPEERLEGFKGLLALGNHGEDALAREMPAGRDEVVFIKKHIVSGNPPLSFDHWMRTPLHFAARDGYSKAVQLLIDNGADVNCLDGDQATPLHEAAKNDHVETARMLLERGADINARQKWGVAPIHAASHENNVATVRLLIENKADVNIGDEDGRTPLDWAMGERHKGVSDLLRSHGAKLRGELKAEK